MAVIEGSEQNDQGLGTVGLFASTLNRDDELKGLGGDDNILGGRGNDTLNGGTGNDTLVGGNGNDVYAYVGTTINFGADVIRDSRTAFARTITGSFREEDFNVNVLDFRQSGDDAVTIDLNRDEAQQVIANRLTLTLQVEDDSRLNAFDVIQNVFGTSTGDVILGNSDDNVLEGEGGTDRLEGRGGEDTLRGGFGADTLDGGGLADFLDGGSGADMMIGGNGDDTFVVNNEGDTVIEGFGANNGNDTIRSSINIDELVTNVENLVLEGNAIRATGNSLDNKLTGNNRDNILDGKAGADTMTGGLGNDTYQIDSTADRIIELAGQGTDTVITSLSFSLQSLESALFGGATVENLTLEEGNSRLPQNGTGNSLDNVITGNSSANQLSGLGGSDRLLGGGGVDVLRGASAGFGEGVGEADVLTGGLGADTFVVGESGANLYFDPSSTGSLSAGQAIITDFSLAENDQIRLSGAGGVNYRLSLVGENTAIDVSISGQNNGSFDRVAQIRGVNLLGANTNPVFVNSANNSIQGLTFV